MSASTLQWKRDCEVVIGKGSAGQGLSVKDLRIEFEITKLNGRVPNTAMVKIYNLTQDNENRIKGEFDEILINAGYVGASLLVFRGNIRHTFAYREGNDHIMEIDAADGDKDLRKTVVNVTLAAGSTAAMLLDHVVGKFSTTKKGYAVVKDRRRIRGRVVSGLASDVLDDIAAESDGHWSIQDGVLQIVPVDSTLPTEAIVLRSDTGLLGAPEIDDKGIKATCLLNPRLKVGGKVWLNNNDLKAKIAKELETKPGAKPVKTKKHRGVLARLDPDGIYKVYKLVHAGDTRSTEWSTQVFCVGLSKVIPAGKRAA
jgi:hypothetical protein